MEFTIVSLEDLVHCDQPERFGNKALMLSKIEKFDVNILPGFCILISGKENFQRDKLKNDASFMRQYTRLAGQEKVQTLIARSSGMMEDSEEHLFPGIYKSIAGIKSVEELLDAVEECYVSQESEKALWYTKAVHASEAECFCVLIQRELIPEYSGIAYTKLPFEGYWSGDCMMAQMVKGTCAMLAKGEQKGNTYVFHERSHPWKLEREIRYNCLERTVIADQTVEKTILGYLFKTGRKLVEGFKSELDIEWACAGREIYVFQVRPITGKGKGQQGFSQYMQAPYEELYLEKGNDNGLKWNAMEYFTENGMFEKPVLMLEAHLTMEEIGERIRKAEFLNEGLTVRFSYKNQIGMPRAFVYGKEQAIDFIKRNRTQECALILYENINVQDSYEIYIDQEKMIFEHVPGVWESDSRLQADSMVIHDTYTEFWRVETSREARFEDYLGNNKRVVSPWSREEFTGEYKQLLKYIDKIKVLMPRDRAINLHYVRDDRGKIYFLNCRITNPIVDFRACGKEAYPIRNSGDFEKWDGNMPLLICPDLVRGEEILLMEIVPCLKKVSVPILIDFGILSHPAIMLREMGINVTPRFMCHDHFRLEGPEY